MDNLLSLAEKYMGYSLVTLREYQNTIYKQGTTCPNDKITKMYTELLYFFYKGIEGWHGDLHADNIQVILNQGGVPVRMVVIDYGSSVYFKNRNRTRKAKCLDDILNQIRAESSSFPKYRVFWSEPHRTNPGNLLGKTLVKRRQYVYPNSAMVRNTKRVNHQLYLNAKKRGYTRMNLTGQARTNTLRSLAGKVSKTVYNTGCKLGAKACAFLKRRQNKATQNALNKALSSVVVRPQSVTPNTGRKILVGPRGGLYVMGAGTKKNYRRVQNLVGEGRLVLKKALNYL
jgi:hypothetical protein